MNLKIHIYFKSEPKFVRRRRLYYKPEQRAQLVWGSKKSHMLRQTYVIQKVWFTQKLYNYTPIIFKSHTFVKTGYLPSDTDTKT